MTSPRRSLHRAGRRYRRAREQCFAAYGTVCHICGHEGATETDHLDAVSVAPDQPIDWRSMRPAHGTSGPCPVCKSGTTGRPRCCNQERSNKPLGVQFVPSFAW